MRATVAIAFGISALIAGPAMAQNQPNPNQAAAKALLQAADKAIGASNVKSFTITATGWMGYPGQQFATGDLPRSDLKSYTLDRRPRQQVGQVGVCPHSGQPAHPWRRCRLPGPRRAAVSGGCRRRHRLEYEFAGPACPAGGGRRRRSSAHDLGQPGRLHPGGSGRRQRGGHRQSISAVKTKP